MRCIFFAACAGALILAVSCKSTDNGSETLNRARNTKRIPHSSLKEIFEANTGTFTGVQLDNRDKVTDKICSLVVRSEGDNYTVIFSHFSKKEKMEVVHTLDGDKFDTNEELPFIQATEGFLGGEKLHQISMKEGIFDQFIVTLGAGSEDGKCRFSKFVHINGRTLEPRR